MKKAHSSSEPASQQNARKPLPENMNSGLRRVLKAVVNVLMRLVFRMKYLYKERLPLEGPALVISNHQSYLDIPALCVNIKPWLYFVAKKELFESRFGNRFLNWWGAVRIDREKPSMSAVREIMDLLRQKKHVMIFPQGTRVKDPRTRDDYPAHAGTMHFATKLNVPVVPVCIHGAFKPFHRVEIVFGEPMHLKPIPKGRKGQAEAERMCRDLMRYIYELGEHPNTAVPPASIAYSPEEYAEREALRRARKAARSSAAGKEKKDA